VHSGTVNPGVPAHQPWLFLPDAAWGRVLSKEEAPPTRVQHHQADTDRHYLVQHLDHRQIAERMADRKPCIKHFHRLQYAAE
jgi:hypothetical protein